MIVNPRFKISEYFSQQHVGISLQSLALRKNAYGISVRGPRTDWHGKKAPCGPRRRLARVLSGRVTPGVPRSPSRVSLPASMSEPAAKKQKSEAAAAPLPKGLAMFDLTGKVAVVTGGTGVLGSVMCAGLAAAGAKVAVMGRNADKAQEVVDGILVRARRRNAHAQCLRLAGWLADWLTGFAERWRRGDGATRRRDGRGVHGGRLYEVDRSVRHY
eukprot:COSAG01_NODE_65_length_29252_cov_173.296995_32_plen_215_part_00